MHTLLNTNQLFKTKEVKEKVSEKLAKEKAVLSAICIFLDMQFENARVKPDQTVEYPFMYEYADQILKIAPRASKRYSWMLTNMQIDLPEHQVKPVGFDRPIKSEDACNSEIECNDRLRYNESVTKVLETAMDVLGMEAFLAGLQNQTKEAIELPISIAIELGITYEKKD